MSSFQWETWKKLNKDEQKVVKENTCRILNDFNA